MRLVGFFSRHCSSRRAATRKPRRRKRQVGRAEDHGVGRHPEPRLQRKWLDDFTALACGNLKTNYWRSPTGNRHVLPPVLRRKSGPFRLPPSSICKICLRTASNLSSTVSPKSRLTVRPSSAKHPAMAWAICLRRMINPQPKGARASSDRRAALAPGSWICRGSPFPLPANMRQRRWSFSPGLRNTTNATRREKACSRSGSCCRRRPSRAWRWPRMTPRLCHMNSGGDANHGRQRLISSEQLMRRITHLTANET